MSGLKSEASDETARDHNHLGPLGKRIVECEKTLDIRHLPQSVTCLATLFLRAVSRW